jgi:hypothetical protein
MLSAATCSRQLATRSKTITTGHRLLFEPDCKLRKPAICSQCVLPLLRGACTTTCDALHIAALVALAMRKKRTRMNGQRPHK